MPLRWKASSDTKIVGTGLPRLGDDEGSPVLVFLLLEVTYYLLKWFQPTFIRAKLFKVSERSKEGAHAVPKLKEHGEERTA